MGEGEDGREELRKRGGRADGRAGMWEGEIVLQVREDSSIPSLPRRPVLLQVAHLMKGSARLAKAFL